MKEKYKLQIKLSLLRKDDESGDEEVKDKEKKLPDKRKKKQWGNEKNGIYVKL